MRRRESILRAASLGHCCLHCIQLLAAGLQLDPKQRYIRSVAGFLRQKGSGEPADPPLPSPPHLEQGAKEG